ILEVEAGLAEERGVIVKEQREAGRLVALPGENHLGRRPRAEERLAHAGFRSDHLIGHPLVLGKLLDQPEYQRRILRGGPLDSKRLSRHVHRMRFPSDDTFISRSRRRSRVSSFFASVTKKMQTFR